MEFILDGGRRDLIAMKFALIQCLREGEKIVHMMVIKNGYKAS